MKFLLLFTLLVLNSCSLQKNSNSIDTISIEDSSGRDLSINSENNDDYGPSTLEEDTQQTIGAKKKLIHSLTVYSTLYSSLGLVSLLAESDKRKINFSVIAANGFASLISVLYAKKKSSNYLEWKLFDLLKRLKGSAPYSKRWYSEIEKFLKSEFGNMQLQQLKVLVLIPESTNKGIKLSSTGLVVTKVMNSISLKNRRSFYQSPADFNYLLKEVGVDLNLPVAFLPEKSNFKYLSGYNWGIFTTYLSFLEQNNHLFRSVGTIKEQVLDSIYPLTDISSIYSEAIEKTLNDYQLSIEEWKTQNSASYEPEV